MGANQGITSTSTLTMAKYGNNMYGGYEVEAEFMLLRLPSAPQDIQVHQLCYFHLQYVLVSIGYSGLNTTSIVLLEVLFKLPHLNSSLIISKPSRLGDRR